MKNIVLIGGGTGTSTLAKGLRAKGAAVSIVVSMADDGGSTGILRRELGVLPPGDVRQCMLALSNADADLQKLIAYRFEDGGLKGHNVGNLLFAALEKTTGDFAGAVSKMSEMLQVQGSVIPVTLDNVTLMTHFTTGEVLEGESTLHNANLQDFDHMELSPTPAANAEAITAIESADTVVIAPGAFFSSTTPPLLVPGIAEAIARTNAKSVYICNLANKAGHNEGWSVSDYTNRIESLLKEPLDHVIFNTDLPEQTFAKYAREGESLVSYQKEDTLAPKFIGGDLLEVVKPSQADADLLTRSTIRHNSAIVAESILDL